MSACVLWVALLCACSTSRPPTTLPAAAAATKAAQPSELDLRLAYLKRRIKSARDQAHVPGMAVAVIRNGEIVLAEGFGTSDLASKTPVTRNTLFMVGSTTKAFTATVLGMLVDEGKLGWDDPLSKHVPLKLKTEGDRAATLRDALSHRTGFPRMTLLLFSNLSIEQIYGYVNKAKPSAKLGKKWQYNNIMYAAAGDASARIAKQPWPALVEEKLFRPLGMASATALLAEAQKTGKLSRGYSWNKTAKTYDLEAPRDIGATSPAGAIVANVHDMAKWIRFNMAGGTVDGKALISKAQLAEIHKSQMKMSDDATYGFGWVIKKWTGRDYLQHDGGIDGFHTSVGFLPKAGIGFVVLTNTSGNTMAIGTGVAVFEAMLTDAYKEKDAAAAEDLRPFLGKYLADFDPFDGKVFTVKKKNGKLAVDVPGQMLYELKAPDDKGRRYFAATDQIFVTFAVKDDKATTLELTQGGFRMEIWREGVEPEPDVRAKDVASLLGQYKATEKDGPAVTVRLHRGRLAIKVPKQPLYVLRPPADAESKKWIFRGNDKFFVVFDKKNELAITQPGKTTRAKRTGKVQRPLTLDELLRRRRHQQRRKALANMGRVVGSGTIALVNSGATASVTWTWSGARAWREDIKFDTSVSTTSVSSESGAWVASSFDEAKVLRGDQAVSLRVQHPLALHADWAEFFTDIKLRGMTSKHDKQVAAVALSTKGVPATTAYVDVKTGDVIAADIGRVDQPTLSVTFRNFRVVRGLRVPHLWEFEDQYFGKVVFKRSALKAKTQPRPDTFPPSPPTKR